MDSSREARRRRIMNRGTDRLALITGQIQTIPSDSGSDQPPATQSHSHTASCPPSMFQSLDSPQNVDKASGSLLPSCDSIPEAGEQFIDGDTIGPFIRKCESNKEPSKVSYTDFDGKRQSVEGPSKAQIPFVSGSYKDQPFQSLAHLRTIFTSNEVISAISASENTRTLCSLAVAIVVVLAYVGFPILGSRFIKSVIFFRPLYFLLLTNITIVIARILEKQSGLQRPELQATGKSSGGEHGFADQLSTALELGLLLQNVTGALFMDCSIYAITVICGFSLAQCLSW